jgi:glycosyltransferase involved in cell wall biosynthesis
VKNKKLLFLCPSYPAIGGVEAVSSLLIDFFIEKGFEIFILVSSAEKLPQASLHKHFDLMTPMQGLINSKENLNYIDDFILSNNISCVFNQGIFSESYLHAPQHKEVLFINTLHSCPFWEVEKFKNSSLRELLKTEKTAVNRAKVLVRYLLNKIKPGMSHPSIEAFYRQRIESVSYFVVLDKSYKTELENRLYGSVVQDKIRVIPNPLIKPTSSNLQKKNQVLYVGRLTYTPKRVDRLLRIWKMIQSEITDWELIILGDGEERVDLEKIATALHLNNCRFLGYQSTQPYYESASILCLTSTYEGFPMVLLEAQSYGAIPIAFGCVKSIPSIIDHGDNGFIIKPFDEALFAKQLLSLIKDKSLRQLMSQKAEEKASDFTLDKIGKVWLQLMKKKDLI